MAADPADRFQTVQAMASALSRSAAGADGDPVGELIEAPPAQTDPEVVPSRGFLRHEGRLLGWTLALVAVAAVLVAVGLTLAADDLGNLFGDDNPPGTGRTPGTTVAAPRVKVVEATSFDPYTDDADKHENPRSTGLAIDSDRSSAWRTEGYQQNFGEGGYKEGVGLVLDLGRPQELSQLTLALAPSGGTTLSIYGSDARQATLPGWTKLQAPKSVPGARASFDLDGSYRYLLVWFTSLPQDDDGKYRGGVADVTLRS